MPGTIPGSWTSTVKRKWSSRGGKPSAGVYQPDAQAVRRFEEAFASMAAAWARAQPMLAEVLAGAAS